VATKGDQETSEEQFVLELWYKVTVELKEIDQSSTVMLWS
jgi:hypothetical protein